MCIKAGAKVQHFSESAKFPRFFFRNLFPEGHLKDIWTQNLLMINLTI